LQQWENKTSESITPREEKKKKEKEKGKGKNIVILQSRLKLAK
jgi:hypothetical protein